MMLKLHPRFVQRLVVGHFWTLARIPFLNRIELLQAAQA